MKQSEKLVRQLLSDEMLIPRESFKRSLKKTMMKSTKPKLAANRWFAVPAIGIAILMIAAISMQFVPNPSSQPIVKNPFAPAVVSAKTIEKKSKEFQANLRNIPFITRVERATAGVLYDICNTGGLGVQAGDVWSQYAYSTKDGKEAFYQVKQYADGTTSTTSFYNPSSAQLSEVVSSLIGYPFSFDDGYYETVSDTGVPIDQKDYPAVKENGKYVYKVNLAARSRDDTCDGEVKIMRYTIDAATYTITQGAQYKGRVDENRKIYAFDIDLTTGQLTESQALARMTKAGFDQNTAVREFPAHIP